MELTRNQVQTKYGIIQGFPSGNMLVFKGVPYAKPPVGELRWKAPQEMEAWEGVYHADAFPDLPVAEVATEDTPFVGAFIREFGQNRDYLFPMSEDCLYMNIWTPKNAKGKRLPVAFWIHGGGFVVGGASDLEFDGEAYCEKDVILVSAEYRQGAFGYLAHPWLDAESEQGTSGNYGCLDLIKALKWVYENIEAFGGDPKNITVCGQSAGGISTQILASSPLTGNMISKAIMQSGLECTWEMVNSPTLKEEEESVGEAFVKESGAANLEELRALNADQIMELTGRIMPQMMAKGIFFAFVPVADGYVLDDKLQELYSNGAIRKIPYLTGCVAEEFGDIPEIVANGNPGPLKQQSINWSLKCEELGIPSYAYFFKHELPETFDTSVPPFHSSEIWYTMGTLGRSWRPMKEEDYSLSEEVVTCWTNFMKTGVPAEDWKTYTKEVPFIKEF